MQLPTDRYLPMNVEACVKRDTDLVCMCVCLSPTPLTQTHGLPGLWRADLVNELNQEESVVGDPVFQILPPKLMASWFLFAGDNSSIHLQNRRLAELNKAIYSYGCVLSVASTCGFVIVRVMTVVSLARRHTRKTSMLRVTPYFDTYPYADPESRYKWVCFASFSSCAATARVFECLSSVT